VPPDWEACSQFIGAPNRWDQIRIIRNARAVLAETRVELQRAWSETSFRMQQLRDNPECAQQEYDRILRQCRQRPVGYAELRSERTMSPRR
jgi:phosphoribosylformylglycinamidine synthase